MLNVNGADSEIACDVLVIGSGAGGLAAAISARWNGLDVILAEKEPVFGGTTARSGGAIWIPGNSLAAEKGITDRREDARTYIAHFAGNHFNPAMVDAFLDRAPEMIDAFQQKSAAKFMLDVGSPFSFSDYYLDVPGSVSKGRSLRIAAFDGRKLGSDLSRVAPPLKETTFLGMAIARTEVAHFYNAARSLRSACFAGYRLLVHARDLAFYGKSTRLVNGCALIGGLVKSSLDLGIAMWSSSPATELIVDGGRIAGAVVLKDGKRVHVKARRGVILATGGFPRDATRPELIDIQTRTKRVFPSNSTAGNTGDGIRFAEAEGAQVTQGFPNNFYWTTVSRFPRKDGSVGFQPHSNGSDRSKPGFIAVSNRGRRFTNECSIRIARNMVEQAIADPSFSAFMVGDHASVRRYGLGAVKPFPLPIRAHLKSGYLIRGDTIEELARRAGIDPEGLAATVEAYNRNARLGLDPDFGKGDSNFDRVQGDPSHLPNPCVGPLERPPFYAVKITPAIIGSFSGLKTNVNAQVLDAQGAPIEGLYAVGNDMANILAGEDAAAGVTLGPAMTFGYIAANHLAGDRS